MAFAYYSQRDLENALAMMQKSVQLSRDYSTPANIASALNNIALIQFSLGRPLEASETLNEAILLVADVSNNFLAQALANKAELAAYLGEFSAALTYFERAISLFQAMEDESGLVEVHLLWGYEYEAALGHVEAAQNHFQQAEALIEKKPEYYAEEKLRLLLGKTQLASLTGSLADAENHLQEASRLLNDYDLSWWQPAFYYYRGEYFRQQGDLDEARRDWQLGLDTIEARHGCPDYQPLILLGEARIAADPDIKTGYLLNCLQRATPFFPALPGPPWGRQTPQ
jgi:tetratricopeptide (TPR) repeat protein